MTRNNYFLPAEWASQDAVMIAWPHADTDWNYMLPAVHECYKRLAREISRRARLLVVAPDIDEPRRALKGLVDESRTIYFQAPTNDTWTRDYGFITAIAYNGETQVHDFKFNGWGLKFASDRDNMVNTRFKESALANPAAQWINNLSFVLEGGSVDINEDGVILTTAECMLSPNRNGGLSKAEIEDYVLDMLGGERMIWLEHGYLEGDDTDSHVDTLARFLPGGIIAYTACDRPDDSHYGELQLMEQELRLLRNASGKPFHLLPLPIPDEIRDEDGQRLPATYANFLLINDALLLPVYGDEHYDAIAINALTEAVGDAFEIIPIDCRALIQQHGSLHCATMQIPHGVLL